MISLHIFTIHLQQQYLYHPDICSMCGRDILSRNIVNTPHRAMRLHIINLIIFITWSHPWLEDTGQQILRLCLGLTSMFPFFIISSYRVSQKKLPSSLLLQSPTVGYWATLGHLISSRDRIYEIRWNLTPEDSRNATLFNGPSRPAPRPIRPPH